MHRAASGTAVPDPEEFAGLRSLVTGGTRGIGRSVAARLGAGGANVVVTSRSATDDLPRASGR